MATTQTQRCVAFEGHRCIAAGEILEVARRVKEAIEQGMQSMVLIFDAVTSDPVEIDFRGSLQDVLERVRTQNPAGDTVASIQSGEGEAQAGSASTAEDIDPDTDIAPEAGEELPRGPGRPKLGVIAREVTLLPRHWEWLGSQPGGASATMRRLVETARRENRAGDEKRAAQDAAYKFMNAVAGNLPGFEEATRALFAWDRDRFHVLTEEWPADIRDHARTVAEGAFSDTGDQ
ncbi:MAG: DUF2239 family protein [Bacteroidetes bacterium]|nr:DUF2239 family protein [Bacteroidota bacterium]